MEKHLECFMEGKNSFLKKDYEKAQKLLLKCVADHPSYADVHNMLGVIYHAQGEFSLAIEHFEKAIQINPNYTEALLNLAVLYNDLGKYKKASVLYARVHPKMPRKKKEKINPFLKNKLANKHAELGDIYAGIGLYPESIGQYEYALKLRPKFLDIKLKWGLSLREYGKYKQALKVFSDILRDKPNYAQARVQLGVTYFALGKNKKAEGVWRETLKKNPQEETAKMYLKLAGNE